MHPTEKKLLDEIRETFAAHGATDIDKNLWIAMKSALTRTDELFWLMLHFSELQPELTVASAFQGIRVLVQISKPMPGVIQFRTDSAPLVPTQLEHDVGWGRQGLALNEREQIELLRIVYRHIAESLPSFHARLELLSALEEEAPRPAPAIWDLLSEFPDQASIEAVCRIAMR